MLNQLKIICQHLKLQLQQLTRWWIPKKKQLTRVLKEVRGGNEFQSHQEVRIQITGYIESQVFDTFRQIDTFSVEEL